MIKPKAIPRFFLHCYRALPWTTWLGIFLIGTFFWFWIFGNQGLVELEKLRQAKVDFLAEKENLLKEKESLEAELKRLKDPRHIKHLIHKDLGFVEDGEIMIQFNNKIAK